MNTVFSIRLKPRLAIVLVLCVAAGSAAASAQQAMRVLRGADQQTVYGSAFPAPLVVWVTDTATERAVPSLRVDFSAGKGIGLSAPFAITDEQGLASVSATGLATGTSSVSAEVSGSPELKVNFDGLFVGKAILTVIPADLSMLQGTFVPAVTNYTISGLVNGDTEETAAITGLPVLTTTAKDKSPRANYAIKGGVGSLSSPNYNFVAGFGTLAILDGNGLDADGTSHTELVQTASLGYSDQDVAVVRAGFMSQLDGSMIPQPSFVAGLRGESGVFVVNAMWPNSQSTPRPSQPILMRSALTTVVADAPKAPDAPVRAAVVTRAASPAATQPSDMRSALPAVSLVSQKSLEAPVRAVLVTGQGAQANLTGVSNRAAIRRAFNSPGTN